MSHPNPTHRMFEALLAISEHDSAHYELQDAGNEIRVCGPANEAVYRPDCWTSHFTRHLYSGYFEQRISPPPP